MAVVHEPIEDGVGKRRLPEVGVPGVHRQLADQDRRARGHAIVEDLGDAVYAAEIRDNAAPELELYSEAIDTLLQLHKSSPPRSLEYKGAEWPVMLYDETALLAETDLLLDWYAEKPGFHRAARRQAWLNLSEIWRGTHDHAFSRL